MGDKGYYLDKHLKETDERPWTAKFFLYLPFQPSVHQNMFNQHTSNIDIVFKVGIQHGIFKLEEFSNKRTFFSFFHKQTISQI